ncbi:MAG TPA: hypothetical protein VFO86_02520, partial [Terriglobia bacterium]|nr:hypothetical protein [Terriglobia bacterium]
MNQLFDPKHSALAKGKGTASKHSLRGQLTKIVDAVGVGIPYILRHRFSKRRMTEPENSLRPLQPRPRHFFAEFPIAAKKDKLKESVGWLSEQGVTYYQSRIGKYIRDIEYLVQVQEEGRLEDLDDEVRYVSIINSLFESSDVISIYEGLHPIVSGHLAKRLREFVRGAAFAHSETANSIANRGRDVGFELYLASLCARAGYEIDFGTTADVI